MFDVLPSAYGRSEILQAYVITQTPLPVYHHQSKIRLTKRNHLESSVSLLDIKLWLVSFINNGYRACMLLWKQYIYNFPKESELPFFSVKISWLIFPAVSGVEMKNLHRSKKAHFPSLLRQFRTRDYATHACAPTWACLRATFVTSGLTASKMVVLTSQWALSTSHKKFVS